MKIKDKKILVHNNIRTLSIYNFCMIVISNDMRYLIKNYNDDLEPDSYENYKNDQSLVEVWNKIRDQYDEAIGDNSERNKYISLLEIEKHTANLSLVNHILDIYELTADPKILWEINDIEGFSFKHYDSIGPQIDKILIKMKHLKNKLNILNIKFEDKHLKNKDNKNDNLKSLIDDIESTAMVFEIDLGIPYKINVKDTSTFRWLKLIKLKEQKDEDAERLKQKRK